MKKIVIGFLLVHVAINNAAAQTFSADDLQSLQASLSQQPNQNGTLNKTFGSNGTTVLTSNIGGGTGDYIYGMLIDADQKIVTAGSSAIGGLFSFSIARFTSFGTLDTSFNSLGTNSFAGTNYVPFSISGRTNVDDDCRACILNDNKYVLGGYTRLQAGNTRFGLAQFTKAGILDSTFGTNGTTYISTAIAGAGNDGILTMCKQIDGKIIAAGNSNNRFALARFLQNGTLDTSFNNGAGTNYITTFISGAGNDQCYASGIQSNGNIILAGTSNNFMAIACFTPTGILNTSFGGNGTGHTFITPTIAGGGQDECYALAIQPDDKIILAGYSFALDGIRRFALARFLPNGSLDTTFGTNGTTYIPNFIIVGANSVINSIQLQPDGKIVASGQSFTSFAFARFNTNGTLDTTFGTNGTCFITENNLNNAQVIVLTGTTIIAAGSGDAVNRLSLASLSNIPSLESFDQANAGQAGMVA